MDILDMWMGPFRTFEKVAIGYAIFYIRNVIAVYWNIDESGFIGDEAIARARIKNAVVQLAGLSEWYVEFLSETVRPAIEDAITAIEAYQSQV